MIHLVTALRAEAEPLIEAFALRRPEDGGGFEIFFGEGATLVISGVGRVAAAAGTAYLRALCPADAAWLNVGVGAHARLAIGTPVVAHKIVEAASERRWFPQLIVTPPFATATVCTVDRAVRQAEGDRLYEMEASAFFATATRWATAEVIASVKLVSDRGIVAGSDLCQRSARTMIAERADEIVAYARQLEALLDTVVQPPSDLAAILDRWHFSVTQRRQLGRLEIRARALGACLEELLPADARSSRQVLFELGNRLDRLSSEPL